MSNQMDHDNAGVTTTSLMVSLAAFVIVVAGLKVAAPILAEFLLALFIAVVCVPPIKWLSSKRIPQGISILIVLTGVLAFLGFVGYLVGDSIQSFSANKDLYSAKLDQSLGGAFQWLAEKGVPIEGLELAALIDQYGIALVSRVVGGLNVIFQEFFIIFLSVIFILAEMSSFPDKFARAFSDSKDKMIHVNKILGKIRHYLAIKTVASLFTGFIVSMSLYFIGVDFPFLWGMLAFLLNYIPNIGSIIAAIPPLILAFVQLGPAEVLWTAITFAVANTLVGNFLEPKFMGKMLGLSTFVVFLSLIFWGWIFGSVGMFLSVPLTMTIKIALETNPSTHWIAIMLGPENE
ncbi:MAG: AI-2E family transporter [Kangiellaceae bacterium]|jgi:AI-2 transport protein TqsA